MTALAVFESEIASERSLAVVTRDARRSARRWKVFGCGWRTNLARLRGAGG
jgi:hypothetical protein